MDPIVPTTVYYLGKYLLQLSQKRTQKRTWIYVLKKDNVKTIVQFLFFPRQVVCETLECGGRAKIRHLVVIISIRKLKKKEATHVKTSFRTYCRHVLDYFKRFRSAIKEHTIVINSQKKNRVFIDAIITLKVVYWIITHYFYNAKYLLHKGKKIGKYLHNKLLIQKEVVSLATNFNFLAALWQ